MHQTPWTRKVAPSSLPSDRLRPKPPTAPSRSKSSQSNEPALPQSRALRILNGLRTSLQDPSTSTTLDPTGGCFCQGIYPLLLGICIVDHAFNSAYTSSLTICSNIAPLLTPTQRSALITRIETEIADTTLKEQLARERAEEERRTAAGAFPSLQSFNSSYPPPHSSSHRPSPPPEPQTYKVLSIGPKTKKTMLTTTTIRSKVSASPSPQDSRPPSPQPIREPRPDANLGKGKGKARLDPMRPWANLNGDSAIYTPPVRSVDEVEANPEGKAGTGRRRRGKGKGKEKEESVQVGTSGGSKASGS
ncbi:hypothetical protein C0995_011462 [Termitomyces sp. Mi166|nr:hypothetical protein C0995_011462 [Termitomyces sp. Mi166\